MTVFKEVAILKRMQGPLADLQKEFQMKFSTNVAIQILATVGQLINASSGLLPPNKVALCAGVLAGLQAIVAAFAHYANPDGTPCAIGYKSKSEIK